MATIDTSLFPSATFKVDTGEAMPVTSRLNALRESQLGDIKFRQAQQEEADNMLLRQAYNAPDPVNFLAQQGRGDLVPAVKESMYKTQTAEALATQRGEEAKKAKFEAANKRQEFVNQAMQDMAANPSDANITAWAQDSVLKGLFAQDEADSLLQQTLAIPLDQRKSVFTQLGMSGKEKADVVRQTAQTKNEEEQRRQEDARIALERRRVQIAEAQNKRDQATFDQEQSTAGQLGITKAAYQKLESAYPASTAANESANFAIDSQIADLKALRDHKGLSSIAGPFDAATKGLQVTEDTTAAQALFDKVASGQTIQNLIDLRRASPTGAGLSSISDKDVAMLKEGTGLNQRQYTPALKAQINSAIEKLENAKEVMNKQYKTTYSYKSSAPSTPATGGGAQTPPQAAIDMLLKNPSTAAQFDQIFGAGASAKYLPKGK